MTRWLAILIALGVLATPAQAEQVAFDADEIAQTLRHGPWPPPAAPDPSNRVSGQPAAAALGRALFFDRRLSPDGAFSCASCHEPAHGWAEAKPVSQGRVALHRNAPSVLDVRARRWFGWDGGQDSLWAMSLRPILEPKELAARPEDLSALLRRDAGLAACYAKAFGREAQSQSSDALLVDLAKALAAYQETLVSPRSPFDDFRDALSRDAMSRDALSRDAVAGGGRDAAYPLAAQRGLKLFIGRGNCALCHLGPAFSNGEFHDAGVPFFTPDGADAGRHAGIKHLRESPYTLLGRWNDDPIRANGQQTRLLEPQHRNFGEFRTPSLRNVALSAPYMHNGSKATLRDVVKHYSEIDPERLHADGEAILKPLNLSEGEIDDLVAFLTSLTSSAPIPTAGPETCR